MNIQNISTKTIETRVVGVTYDGRQAVVAQLREEESVLLVRDPRNPFDHNAIKVVRQDGQQIGFLDRYLAAELASQLDYYGRLVKAVVLALTGGYYEGSSLGVVVQCEIPN
ncbi:HIRAN domain-containing protein [Chloroflexota bacterium]